MNIQDIIGASSIIFTLLFWILLFLLLLATILMPLAVFAINSKLNKIINLMIQAQTLERNRMYQPSARPPATFPAIIRPSSTRHP